MVHEYETFTDDTPAHSWLVVGEYQNKRDADAQALKLNFNDFCLNKITRWPKKYHRVKDTDNLDTKDLQQIVLYVLQNVNAKTGSKNQYWGRGYYIISDERLKIRKGVKKIKDIHALLKDTTGHEGGTNHDHPSDSESEYFEESEYESGTDSETEEAKKEEESDHGTDDERQRDRTAGEDYKREQSERERQRDRTAGEDYKREQSERERMRVEQSEREPEGTVVSSDERSDRVTNEDPSEVASENNEVSDAEDDDDIRDDDSDLGEYLSD